MARNSMSYVALLSMEEARQELIIVLVWQKFDVYM